MGVFSCEFPIKEEIKQTDAQAKRDAAEADISQQPDLVGFEPLPESISSEKRSSLRAFAERLQSSLLEKCPGLYHFYHPSDSEIPSIALCIRTMAKDVGIYATRACVFDLVDHVYMEPRPFYEDKDRHWGHDGECTPRKMKEKLADNKITTTENPISYLRLKYEEGFKSQVIQDKYQIAPQLMSATQQKLSPPK